MDVPELNQYPGRLIREASGNKWRTLVGRRVKTYMRPVATDCIYSRITGLKECMNAWYKNEERSPPLINCKIISVIYSRNKQRKTSVKTSTPTTDEAPTQSRWTNYEYIIIYRYPIAYRIHVIMALRIWT